ncbi:MAG: hypothetical protein M4D80_06445 [Myxococcota bacterium]|nr:hypothetical protein [Deltaproteobacteria bacterium]MDQ3334778.1 hypothetical protein [Myxococcota bacterium]
MRIAYSFTLISLVACGGGGESTPDAPKDIGFSNPVAPLMANREVSEDNWEEIGPADLTCLNTAPTDQPTSVPVALSTVVRDFQSDNLVPMTMITVFRGQNTMDVLDTKMSDGNAAVTFNIPAGVTRFGYKMVNDSSLDTLLLNQKVEPNNPTQTEGSIKSVSKTTAQTLPALIGVSRTVGTGVLAGAIRDCQDREISNFIATVSTTKGTVTHAAGTDTYYFSPTVGLPVRHSQQKHGSKNGLFMIIELQPAPTAYVQVWGYKTAADMASDTRSLIAELQTNVIADTVITGSYEPLRQ